MLKARIKEQFRVTFTVQITKIDCFLHALNMDTSDDFQDERNILDTEGWPYVTSKLKSTCMLGPLDCVSLLTLGETCHRLNICRQKVKQTLKNAT